jgi:hypothetical protein
MKWMLVCCALTLCAFPAVSTAHDGPITVLTGTVRAVQPDRIQVDTFDAVAMRPKDEWLFLDAKTKFFEGKKRVEVLDLKIGQAVDTLVQSGEDADGTHRLRAVQIKMKAPKQR